MQCTKHDLESVSLLKLKCCPTGNQADATLNLSDTAVRKWTWICVKKLQALKHERIVWPSHWNPSESSRDQETTFAIAVDGVHCRIHEPQHGRCSKNPAFCSHKFKQAGLGYEVAMSIYENRCVWLNGPFPAGQNDVSIFRSALKQKMHAGQLGIANKGYRGEATLLAIPSSHDMDEVREFKGRALARHEKFNGQLKNFGCVSGQFRHHCEGFEKHQMCFEAIAVVCQHQLENGSPLVVV